MFSQYFYSGVCYSIVLKIMLLKILFYVLKNKESRLARLAKVSRDFKYIFF